MSKMLIDARHPEETRVVVANGNKIEDFDFESADKKQLKGNIYLARVTRVEPSLQAAFVEYGGNRHGFLAFSEIHPDYYQIPHEDRAALIAEERAASRSHDDDDDEDEAEQPAEPVAEADDAADAKDDAAETDGEPRPSEITEAGATEEAHHEAHRAARSRSRRRYKIQEVIKKRQVLLVQVVKEERGGKGAALTTYLSLAGRYCVLMPNTLNGGGISRKISNGADRKRLKEIMSDMLLPDGMACIIRTAGLKRTRAEIKRDFDYLTRLWDEIREKTLKSQAPALVYEDSSLIKRAIRDIYSREIDEIIIDGEEGYRASREFMKLLMPSHAKRVQLYKDRVPIFHRYQVETQLETMFHPTVQLKSGGYIVINPTEALVSIDINSGRSTKEHNIEETAVKTNCEAADEIARQLRLRDMAGLVVIDFIDMDENRNIKRVEKQLKEALKNDRARIQVGRISQFGLMEMSRQRLRTGVLEASTHECEHCKGHGFIRSIPSSALYTLRAIEEETIKGRAAELTIFVAPEVAVYLLNKKRRELGVLEGRYGILLDIQPKPTLFAPDVEIERIGTEPGLPIVPFEIVHIAEDPDDDIVEEIDEEEVETETEAGPAEDEPRAKRASRDRDGREREADDSENGGRGGRRRRRKRRGGERDAPATPQVAKTEADGEADTDVKADALPVDGGKAETEEERSSRRRRRRGRRGGRNRHREDDTGTAPAMAAAGDEAGVPAADGVMSDLTDAVAVPVADTGVQTDSNAVAVEEVPKKAAKRSRARKTKVDVADQESAIATDSAAEAAPVEPEAEARTATDKPAKAARPSRAKSKAAIETKAAVASVAAIAEAPEAIVMVATAVTALPEGVITGGNGMPVENKPTRKGWWQRTFGD
jgi:ribonuclease E